MIWRIRVSRDIARYCRHMGLPHSLTKRGPAAQYVWNYLVDDALLIGQFSCLYDIC